jgi:hypothetical protein
MHSFSPVVASRHGAVDQRVVDGSIEVVEAGLWGVARCGVALCRLDCGIKCGDRGFAAVAARRRGIRERARRRVVGAAQLEQRQHREQREPARGASPQATLDRSPPHECRDPACSGTARWARGRGAAQRSLCTAWSRVHRPA